MVSKSTITMSSLLDFKPDETHSSNHVMSNASDTSCCAFGAGSALNAGSCHHVT